MSDADDPIPRESLALAGLIAVAIRAELGAEIDAYPGFRQPERADPINRAYRAAVLAILARAAGPDAAPALLSRTLRHLAGCRLDADGWDVHQVRALIEHEPGSPDDWLAFLVLSARSQIEPVLDPDED
jgi:hypothetical protein